MVGQDLPKPKKVTPSVDKAAVDVAALKRYNKGGPLASSPEDKALAYLAKVLVEAYFEQKKYAPTK